MKTLWAIKLMELWAGFFTSHSRYELERSLSQMDSIEDVNVFFIEKALIFTSLTTSFSSMGVETSYTVRLRALISPLWKRWTAVNQSRHKHENADMQGAHVMHMKSTVDGPGPAVGLLLELWQGGAAGEGGVSGYTLHVLSPHISDALRLVTANVVRSVAGAY